MIKRLKWNVLYGGGDGVDSDGGLSSSSEDEDYENDPDILKKQAEANKLLQELVERDPLLAETLHQKLEAAASDSDSNENESTSSSSDGSDGAESAEKNEDDNEAVEPLAIGREVVNSSEKQEEDSEVEYAEWRECNLCPGKRFLNDAEVDQHLSSKKHVRAEAKYNKQMSQDAAALESGPGETSIESSSKANHSVRDEKMEEIHHRGANENSVPPQNYTKEKPDDINRRKERRKAAAKRKLKALRRRKWEKKKNEKLTGLLDKPSENTNITKNGDTPEARSLINSDEPVASKIKKSANEAKTEPKIVVKEEKVVGKSGRNKASKRKRAQEGSGGPGKESYEEATTLAPRQKTKRERKEKR